MNKVDQPDWIDRVLAVYMGICVFVIVPVGLVLSVVGLGTTALALSAEYVYATTGQCWSFILVCASR